MMRLLFLSLLLLQASCVTVRAWQREQLSRRCMALDDEFGALTEQVRGVRVGGLRAGTGGGGGCGCR